MQLRKGYMLFFLILCVVLVLAAFTGCAVSVDTVQPEATVPSALVESDTSSEEDVQSAETVSTAWAVVPEPAKESRTISLSEAIHFTILSSNKTLFSVSNPAYEPDKRMSIQLSLNSFPDCGGT